tara:strand:- start:68 stop:553 length:486 start_codon:yes stop_codon:yes gene_type:complete
LLVFARAEQVRIPSLGASAGVETSLTRPEENLTYAGTANAEGSCHAQLVIAGKGAQERSGLLDRMSQHLARTQTALGGAPSTEGDSADDSASRIKRPFGEVLPRLPHWTASNPVHAGMPGSGNTDAAETYTGGADDRDAAGTDGCSDGGTGADADGSVSHR